MTTALIITGWVLCGFLAYGRELAELQRTFPDLAEQDRDLDRDRAWITAIFGPIALVVSLIFCRHGFMWRLPPRDGA